MSFSPEPGIYGRNKIKVELDFLIMKPDLK